MYRGIHVPNLPCVSFSRVRFCVPRRHDVLWWDCVFSQHDGQDSALTLRFAHVCLMDGIQDSKMYTDDEIVPCLDSIRDQVFAHVCWMEGCTLMMRLCLVQSTHVTRFLHTSVGWRDIQWWWDCALLGQLTSPDRYTRLLDGAMYADDKIVPCLVNSRDQGPYVWRVNNFKAG